MQIGPVGSGVREDEGKRGKRKRRKKNKDDQVVLTTKFLFNTRAGPDAFPHKKNEKQKTHQSPSNTEKTNKNNFSILGLFFTWFGFFPWADPWVLGLGPRRLTQDRLCVA